MTITTQQLNDPPAGILLLAEQKPAAILALECTQDLVQLVPGGGVGLPLQPSACMRITEPLMPAGIVPPDDIFQAFHALTMLAQNDHVNPMFLSPQHLIPKPVMSLADIAAQLVQILLPIYNQSGIIKVHVIPDIKF